MLINFVFLVHGAFALLLALLLLAFPAWTTQILIPGLAWQPGPMADVAIVYARFTAAGLVLIVLGTAFARQSASTRLRRAALRSMLTISLVAAVLSLLIPFSPLRELSAIVNVVFALAYLWCMVFRGDEI